MFICPFIMTLNHMFVEPVNLGFHVSVARQNHFNTS